MPRKTQIDVEYMETRVNENLAVCNSPIQIKVTHSYGKTNIDLYEKTHLMDTIRAGLTSGEAYEFLFAMAKGLEFCRISPELAPRVKNNTR